MQHKKLSRMNTKKNLISLVFSASFLTLSQISFANTITFDTPQIINTPTTYKNVTLNINGGFIIKPGGSLDIQNSTVNVQISPSSPFFSNMTAGALILKNNTFNVTSNSQTASTTSGLIVIDQGSLEVTHNSFTINMPNSLTFLYKNNLHEENGYKINENTIKNFYAGIVLLNTHSSEINENTLTNISQSCIFLRSVSLSKVEGNILTFQGNTGHNDSNNAIEIINSNGLKIKNNIISSSASYGIHITGGDTITIDDNRITDGITFGIAIKNPLAIKNNAYLSSLGFKSSPKENFSSSNTRITIKNNYIAQNRYGLIADNVDSLIVVDNVFIQRFDDPDSRKYWTNNIHLLNSISDLVWKNNLYKEAFTQEVPGINDLSKEFVKFPEEGGVSL